jgi:hypothetical protein
MIDQPRFLKVPLRPHECRFELVSSPSVPQVFFDSVFPLIFRHSQHGGMSLAVAGNDVTPGRQKAQFEAALLMRAQ